jgi:hypothetical protein
MNHVLELFRNLKTREKNIKKVLKLHNLVCEEVATLKLIPYILFSFPSMSTI